jgi:hypothetical protein
MHLSQIVQFIFFKLPIATQVRKHPISCDGKGNDASSQRISRIPDTRAPGKADWTAWAIADSTDTSILTAAATGAATGAGKTRVRIAMTTAMKDNRTRTIPNASVQAARTDM